MRDGSFGVDEWPISAFDLLGLRRQPHDADLTEQGPWALIEALRRVQRAANRAAWELVPTCTGPEAPRDDGVTVHVYRSLAREAVSASRTSRRSRDRLLTFSRELP